jgi:hypothetical protein
MEPHFNLYFREIVYHKPKAKKDSVCGVFSYEAINVEETQLGSLYLVGKISGFPSKKYKNFDFLLNLLASAVKREFYSDPQKSTLEALESAVQSANIYLADFAKKGHKEWIGNIDFSCIAFSKNSIHIAQAGNMLTLLFRGDSMTNIARKFSNKSKKSQPLKPFSNIASGSLEEDDKIIVSTPDILDITSNQKIKGLISQPTSEQLYEYLKDNLKKISSLACLILESKSKPLVIEKKGPSIEKAPKIEVLNLEMVFNSKSNKFNNIIKTKIPPSSKYSKALNPLLKHHLTKYLLIFFLFLLLILSPYLVQKINYDLKLSQIDNLVKRTKQAINKSEISLTYQNQFEAQALLQQANVLIVNAFSLLTKLPEEVKKEPAQNLQLIQESLDTQKNSINNIVNITQPEQIADLSKNSFTFNPHGILKLEDNLYLYELSSGFLYKIDLNDIGSPTLIFLSSKDTFKLGAIQDNALVLLSTPEKIYIYDTDDSYNTRLLKPDLENTHYIKDMANYDDYIYFLDAEYLNILKYAPQANSLIGSNWLNDPPAGGDENLIGAQSLAIDGSVYVSRMDGTIIEYISGRKVAEFKPNVSPEITKGGQIFTKKGMKNLYIIDSENNRIIAMNKNDGLTTQYVSAQFTSLHNLWVTADERTIYLLDGLRVYRIDI